MQRDYLTELQRQVGREWPNIRDARQAAESENTKIAGLLSDGGVRPVSTDADVVVFGSLARGEWTSQSDIDWNLLIDGQADPGHRQLAHRIGSLLGANYPKPGATGTFGSLAFSHDIIHLIGGEADTNIKTTQRVLLLLESAAIDFEPQIESGSSAYARVIRNLIDRYLSDDTNFISKEGMKSRVPRFLLNDVVRFWRTMCVDFGWKGWEQPGGKKWALRNIKLRMSRKLTFAAGLLMCAHPHLDGEGPAEADAEQVRDDLRCGLVALTQLTPLQLVSQALLRNNKSETSIKLLDAYDWFLGLLNDQRRRGELEKLGADEAYANATFNECRAQSRRFQEALTALFFRDNEQLAKFTIEYGVF